jgi:hypothetical protein
MSNRKAADFVWREGPYILAADLKGTKPVLASLLIARQLAQFEVQPLGTMVLSLGSVKQDQVPSMLAEGASDLIRGVHKFSSPTHKPIAKRIIHAQVLNELSEAIVDALGMIIRLQAMGSAQIVLPTAQTHQSLLSLGHHKPAVYLSQVLDTPIATIHYRVDLARRRQPAL